MALKLGMRDDPLMFLITSTKIHLYKKSRAFRIFLISLMFYQLTRMCSGYYHILYSKNSPVFMQLKYLPYLGICSSITLSNVSLIFAHKFILNTTEIVKNNAWCLRSADDRTYQRIVKHCKFIKTLHISAFIVICASTTSLVVPLNHDIDWNILLANPPFSKMWTPLMELSYYLFGALGVYTLTVNINSANYIVCQVLFQYQILNQYVIRLARTSIKNKDRFGYQDDIYKQITNLVRIHIQIKKFKDMMLLYGDYATLALTFVGIHIFLCVAAFMIFNVHPQSNWRICMSLVPAVLFALNISSNGQRTKDESERVYYNALECGWYNWNMKNRRAYLIFLINNMEPTSFSNTRVYDIDHSLFLFMCRTGYAMFTLFMSVREKNI